MVDRTAAARAIEEFLRALGYEIDGDLEGTGQRVADAWIDDLLAGEPIDAAAVLRDGAMDAGEAAGLVVIRDLAVTTMCPHHLLPGFGTGTVAYLPGERVAGIGRIAHVLDVVARRLTIQERIGATVADLLVTELGARGALCRLALTHTCLAARGERQASAIVETLHASGTFAEPGPDRELALSAIARAWPRGA
jgi:GTP cyclohydrolase I